MFIEQEQKEEMVEKEQREQLWQGKEGEGQRKNRHLKSNKENLPHNSSLQNHNNSADCPVASNKEDQEEIKCQSIYENWKMKEKMKSQQKVPTPTNKQIAKEKPLAKAPGEKGGSGCKDHSGRKPQAHEPDYFYQKGLGFQYAKEVHAEHLFKERYPFQLNRDCSLTPAKKAELHERLHK
jgi:hypothetical protein